MAPEVSESETYEGPPCDVFSCGVLLFMMHTAIEPFYKAGDKWHKLIMKNPDKALKQRGVNLSDHDGFHLILSMLEIDPSKRLTVEEIKNHAWFKSNMAT